MTDHRDRLRWNARYEASEPHFAPHPLVEAALSAGLPDGPVLELACGRSGSALALAAAGRQVIAVDVSDVALAQLAAEARRRGVDRRIHCVLADVPSYDAWRAAFALVLCTRFWDATAFRRACASVASGGLLGWEALCRVGNESEPWRIAHGELRARLPGEFLVLAEEVTGDERVTTRLLARREFGANAE
jgi:SAM-dependent methyltransferase